MMVEVVELRISSTEAQPNGEMPGFSARMSRMPKQVKNEEFHESERYPD